MARHLGIGAIAGSIERIDLQAAEFEIGVAHQRLYLIDDRVALHPHQAGDHLPLNAAFGRIQMGRADLNQARQRAILTGQ